uniref:Uncharacterized protein n=1 Tax=Romanomermis culicivorax TaxID=13658 RepID=A0A915J8E2_ROMCU
MGNLNDADEKPYCSSESPDGCHCDRKDSTAADHGELYGREAGIWKASFKQLARGDVEGVSEAYWTLGNVTCTGIVGWNESIQLKNTSLEMPFTWTGRKLIFRFKTDQQNAILLEQRHKGNIFYLGFENASTLKLSLRVDGDPNMETSLLSQRPLDDNKWHTIILQYKWSQIRLIVDYWKEGFLNLENGSENLGKYFKGNLIFGGSGANFSGCLSYLAIENRPTNLTDLITGSKLQNGCQDLCQVQSSKCLNSGRCTENYSQQSFQCLCPDFVTGDFCENDINKDTDVTLFDAIKSYALIANFTENPLTNDVSFGFRTDQVQGLLLYIHDQFHNFRQLHLWSSNKLTLTTNYGRSIRRCTVSNVEKDFDTMQWIHVEVGRRDDHVILKVGDLWCKIDGPQDYSLSYVESWDNEQDAKGVEIFIKNMNKRMLEETNDQERTTTKKEATRTSVNR